ncbi:single-stranded-DNA-specific exonuclease RecJ [Pleurocapsa sp. PCC 7327]|uniref:single-stranded-DNA-specific exonuclease RecJ n=1 Tax=Pleurocapsa sp. PCC 7327 TaxID=118163 RepID=UPI00029FB1B1|nr:single-stranded-DNA-specific exonuclease RecJ [Pleurocapsa sp. PCC 7327]AFY79035.1 single-stranded-DNA-specific exonuclease RecJ [Pleurocapsa sp. PCC 7327]
MRLPNQRWLISSTNPEQIDELVKSTGLSPLLAQVLVNREIVTPKLAQVYIDPESQLLPSPLEEFSDLALSVELLAEAIATKDKIAICGDYDADGMTSTALLLRTLRYLGAEVDYAIPSRMKDGYGVNLRIVEEFASAGVGIILTVDNGISAYEPIARAIALGMSVIVTDHHDLPKKLPPAHAILNPKLLPESSPYCGLAGVGMAYILAVTLARSLGKEEELTDRLLELFTLGTIADLAPLVGVNRRWLKRGLRQLPKSQLAGIQALMQMAGVSDAQKQLKPDDIGFRLGPRINAVGRIGDPQMVIELLTTDDSGLALERAMQCEQINRKRQELCEQIERDAIALIEETPIDWRRDRVLVVVRPEWHHGVIGIVASRLVERYGVPVFISTYEEDASILRGSARGIEEFNVFEALEFCRDLLGKYGGHKAAGGFSLPAQNLDAFKQKLSAFAHRCLKLEHLKPLIKIDAEANFIQLTPCLYQQIDSLQPWGIGNDFPIFWTRNVRVKEQQPVGKNQSHLKLTLAQDDHSEMKAIAWRWGDYFPLPSRLDIAYKLQENVWNGNKNIELELVGVRLPDPNFIFAINSATKKAIFEYKGRTYVCSWWETLNELRIQNEQGKVLAVSQGQNIGLLGDSCECTQQVDLTRPHYSQLIHIAFAALND